VGDTITIPGWQVTVLAMDGMRADRLRFVPLSSEEGDADDEGDMGDAAGRRTGHGPTRRGRPSRGSGHDAEVGE
jgi:hypothetical protein